MKAPVLACLFLIMTGCATQGSAVRCDGRLEPINMPAANTLQKNSSTPPTAGRNAGEGES
jgi:hypothetical protein